MIRIHDDYDYVLQVDEYEWDAPSLVVLLVDVDSEEFVASLGGVEVGFTVSDHGNIHVHTEDEPFLQQILDELVAEAQSYKEVA